MYLKQQDVENIKKYNKENWTCNYLVKEHINNIDKINKNIDNFIMINVTDRSNICNLDVYSKDKLIGACRLKYDNNIRRFVDV